jgi:uncharacterized protein YeaO (DUF488 family)
MLKLKRAYDPPAREDGRRFLVERLWPRGVRKARFVWTHGLKTSLPVTICASGSATIPENGSSFKNATGVN